MTVLRIPVKTEAPARIWLMASAALVFRDLLELSAKLYRKKQLLWGAARGFHRHAGCIASVTTISGMGMLVLRTESRQRDQSSRTRFSTNTFTIGRWAKGLSETTAIERNVFCESRNFRKCNCIYPHVKHPLVMIIHSEEKHVNLQILHSARNDVPSF